MGNDMSAIGGMFGSTASTFGNNMWLIIAMVVTAVIMALGIAGGIEKANKVMMPLLFIMFVGLGIYIFTLPGSSAGYKYIFTLNPKGYMHLVRRSSHCLSQVTELLSMVHILVIRKMLFLLQEMLQYLILLLLY